jgi:hypothetical protein
MTESIVRASPRMLRIAESTAPPFIARVTGAGVVDLIEPADESEME